jgi:mRNA-degrading endonuclease toxin of MazEF toxin-antitoxin module
MRRGIPDRGDILHLDLDPTLGREQQGQRYVLALTLFEFNHFGLVLVAPITQGGSFARENGFSVSLMGSGGITQGVILCNQVRMLDFKERGGRLVEAASVMVLDEVLARVRTLLD